MNSHNVLAKFIVAIFLLLFSAIMINCVHWKQKFQHMNCKYHLNGKMLSIKDQSLVVELV